MVCRRLVTANGRRIDLDERAQDSAKSITILGIGLYWVSLQIYRGECSKWFQAFCLVEGDDLVVIALEEFM
jgi:hypothetical protein